MKIGSLYLAHSFNDRIEFRKIELELEKELDIELYNPFYDNPERVEEMKNLDKNEIDDIKKLSEIQKSIFENDSDYTTQENSELIVRRDLSHLAAQRGVLIICKKPSFGTAIEMCNAKLMCKPIYFIGEPFCDHPWIKVYSTKTFRNIEEFKQFVKEQND